MPAATDPLLLAAAQRGDEGAFARLTRPYRHELHVHCYRMLGSPQDAEDALQETMLRAWRRLARFEERATLRTWLYRIATNACLRILERRPPPLLPYPEDAAVAAVGPDPHATVEERETVELAYVVLLRRLPPRQRGALVLREALDCSAAEIAELLDTSAAAVNSALQRARATLEEQRDVPRHRPASDEAERALVDEFMRVWADVDIAGLAALLTRDAVLTMPPEDVRIDGAEAIAGFFATVPAEGRLDEIRLRATRANGQPALAAYLRDGEGEHRAYGIMVLTIDGERLSAITGFPGADVFSLFGLPPTWG